jgi:hypothetical protein
LIRKILIIITTSLILLIFAGTGFAQNVGDEQHHNCEKNRHRLALEIGSAYIPDGFESEQGDKDLFVPTIGMEYQYFIDKKWALGVMADVELGEYLVPFGQDVLNRNKVFILTVVGVYEIMTHWEIFAGGGTEFEDHHNLGVLRIGTAYEFLLGKEWDLSPGLSYDYKEEYHSWGIVFSFGKKF